MSAGESFGGPQTAVYGHGPGHGYDRPEYEGRENDGHADERERDSEHHNAMAGLPGERDGPSASSMQNIAQYGEILY